MNSKMLTWTLSTAVILEGCSSRPREFSPTLAAAADDQSAFEAAFATCRQLLVEGKLDLSGRTASAGAGAAAGATTAAVGGTAAAATGGLGAAALASATIVLLPFAILGGAWGMARMKRAKKEKAIKGALAGCLEQQGYHVTGWSKAIKTPVIGPEADHR